MLSRGCYSQCGRLAVCFSYMSPTLSQTPVRITGRHFLPHCCGQEVLPSLPTQVFTLCNSTALTEWDDSTQEEAGSMGFRNWGEGRDEGGMKGSIKSGPQRTIPHQPPEVWLYRLWEGLWTPTVQQKYNVICSCKLKIVSSPHWKKIKKWGKKQVKVILIIYLAKYIQNIIIQHVINIKRYFLKGINDKFIVSFEHVMKTGEWWNPQCTVTLRTYINLDPPHFKWSVVIMDWIVSAQNLCVETPTLYIIAFGERAIEKVSSVSQSCLTLWPHGLQHTRLPCPSPTPKACSSSCPSSQWCHPTLSSSVVPFSSCLQSFPASRSFPVSQFLESGGQSIGIQLKQQSFQWIFSTDFL